MPRTKPETDADVADPEADRALEGAAADAGAESGCVLKSLPRNLVVAAAERAHALFPGNRPLVQPARFAGPAPTPQRIAAMSSKYFGPDPRVLTVQSLDGAPASLMKRILSHMNEWARSGCISFAWTRGQGRIRIARAASGFWSYLGTDILLIPPGQATMNLQGFTAKTHENDFARLVGHETGHSLGYVHEHMRRELIERLDDQKTYAWFRRTYGWGPSTVKSQVLTPVEEDELMAVPGLPRTADDTSVMCYQLPGTITKDGKPILGGAEVSRRDHEYNAAIYPQPKAPPSRRKVAMADDGLGEYATGGAIA